MNAFVGGQRVVCDVEVSDGKYALRLRGNSPPEFITLAGQPATFPPGWKPLFVYTGFAPLFLLAIENEDGSESTWFLNDKLARVAYDNPYSLPSREADILRQRGSILLRAILEQLLGSVNPVHSGDAEGFYRLGPKIRRAIGTFCEQELPLRIQLFDVDLVAADVTQIEIDRDVKVDLQKVSDIFAADFFRGCLGALQSGQLTWESVLRDGFVTSDAGLWIDSYIFAYRVVDTKASTTYFVITAGNPRCVVGIFFPRQNIIFASPGRFQHLVSDRGVSIEAMLIRHVAEYGGLIPKYWSASRRPFVAVFGEQLLGTHLWFDLTGIDGMVRSLPANCLPPILGIWGSAEAYGEVEAIFPETDGLIDRSIHDFVRHAYEQGLCLLRMTHNYVSNRLRQRILSCNFSDPTLVAERAKLEEVRAMGGPLVLIGLRVENRTTVDLLGFCSAVIDAILDTCRDATIILDGHNSVSLANGINVIGSEFQEFATEQPIDVEHRIVNAVRSKYEGKAVRIIDTIGSPISHSFFWCHHADFFVTFYGTGLAKYRWVCNQAGLMIANKWSYRHRGKHLHIYEEEFLQDAAPLHLLPEECVEDDPASPVVVPEPGNPPSRSNFVIDVDGLSLSLRKCLSHFYNEFANVAGRSLAGASPMDAPEFHEVFYLQSYPAAREEIANGLATDARDHFAKFGSARGYIIHPLAPRVNEGAATRSRFGGLWIDQMNYLDIIAGKLELGRIDQRQAELLRMFARDGYVVLEQAIPADLIEAARQALDHAFSGGINNLQFECHAVAPGHIAWRPEITRHPAKALDIHHFSSTIRQLILNDKITEFLGLIFDSKAFVSQTLGFLRGSAQEGHQDSAFVPYTLPRQFAASWIALEDVTIGAGELFYFPGSHRLFSEFLYMDKFKSAREAVRNGYPDEAVGQEIRRHIASLYAQAKQLEISPSVFAARKGDVLIWHADLVHGGNPVSSDITRKSIVTHYCPSRIVPLFMEHGEVPAYAHDGHRLTSDVYRNMSPLD